MSKTFLIADLHFGHQGVCTFLNEDGTKLRPWEYYKDMDEALVENWNSVVGEKDKVYVLGDVALHPKSILKISQCKGDKVLIKGNHDTAKLSKYVELFRDIRASHHLAGCILTHIPIHSGSLARWRANIHGHTHSRCVLLNNKPDPRYICVSVEQINFTPILLEEILKKNDLN